MVLNTEKLSLVVKRIRDLTPRIRAYQLCSKNGTELPLVTAGAHLPFPVYTSGQKLQLRNFFLCSNPNQRDFYEIAVSHETDSGNSVFGNGTITEGTAFECDLPANNFHLHADASPAVLIAEGIGIAPMLTMAYTLAARGRRFSLHYMDCNKANMAFVEELQEKFARNIHYYYTDEAQQLDIMHLLEDAPGNSLFYACGSQKMLEEIERCARSLHIPKDIIQQEHFSTEELEKDKAVVLELGYSNKLIRVQADQPLLAALREAGAPVKFDCCVGDCGICALRILEGEAEHRDHVLSDAQKAEGYICVCVSRSKTEKLVLAL
jgi:ferredoxin-NADP reductase